MSQPARFRFDSSTGKLYELNDQENAYMFVFNGNGLSEREAIAAYLEEVAATDGAPLPMPIKLASILPEEGERIDLIFSPVDRELYGSNGEALGTFGTSREAGEFIERSYRSPQWDLQWHEVATTPKGNRLRALLNSLPAGTVTATLQHTPSGLEIWIEPENDISHSFKVTPNDLPSVEAILSESGITIVVPAYQRAYLACVPPSHQ